MHEDIKMLGLSQVEIWIYGGIILMALAVLTAVAGIIIFHHKERKLKCRLEQEYGNYKKHS